MFATMSTIYKPAGRAGEYSEWAVNLYGGCDHGCKYCYVPSARQITKEQFYGDGARPYKDILTRLETDARNLRGKIATPIMFSFTSDAYQHSEADHQTTRQAITILKRHGFKVCILTKGGMRAIRDFDMLGAGDIIASSLTFTNEADSLKWEPRAALPSSRLELLERAREYGLETWASLEPVINPTQSLELIRLAAPFTDLFKIGTVNYVKAVSDGINWREFALAAVDAVKAAGRAYYLKDDLLKHCPAGTPQRWNPSGAVILHSEDLPKTESKVMLPGF
jgi:DNA repair photolyase